MSRRASRTMRSPQRRLHGRWQCRRDSMAILALSLPATHDCDAGLETHSRIADEVLPPRCDDGVEAAKREDPALRSTWISLSTGRSSPVWRCMLAVKTCLRILNPRSTHHQQTDASLRGRLLAETRPNLFKDSRPFLTSTPPSGTLATIRYRAAARQSE